MASLVPGVPPTAYTLPLPITGGVCHEPSTSGTSAYQTGPQVGAPQPPAANANSRDPTATYAMPPYSVGETRRLSTGAVGYGRTLAFHATTPVLEVTA